MRAYSELYVSGAQQRLGAMLDFAVNGCEIRMADFYERFLMSGLALRFSRGEPTLVAGCSGSELALKVLDPMDKMCLQAQPETALKTRRMRAGLSQSQLARAADVPVRTLQQYEQRRKDINKAQAEYVLKLAHALHCEIEDFLEYSSQPHQGFEYALVEIS